MNKALFVEKELYFLLHAANDNVDDTTYCEDDGEEWVLVPCVTINFSCV